MRYSIVPTTHINLIHLEVFQWSTDSHYVTKRELTLNQGRHTEMEIKPTKNVDRALLLTLKTSKP